MAILHDSHMHSSFSGDSSTPMEDMVRSAIEKGLTSICMTEHLDMDYPVTKDTPLGYFDLDLEAYRTKVFSLRETFKNQIQIRYGIELGLQPHVNEMYADLVKGQPFDFVIGSSHLANQMDPYYATFYSGRDERACYREYFESIYANLCTFSDFDSYGHLDYIVRYGPNRDEFYSYEQHKDIIDAILEKLIAMDKALEINTAAVKYKLRDLHPTTAILMRYKELGGTRVTIGSDAHKPEFVAHSFDIARDKLLSCGFNHYTVYENRTPILLPL
ncbi:MAG: histidinol-phosphatase HisJ family protein [Lachnospiraceae bacterium]